jgi:hypothetical protein
MGSVIEIQQKQTASNARRNKNNNSKLAAAKNNERETLIEVLKTRLDSSDSIIRETDSDSIASDDDSLFCLNGDDTDSLHTANTANIEVFFSLKQQNS